MKNITNEINKNFNKNCVNYKDLQMTNIVIHNKMKKRKNISRKKGKQSRYKHKSYLIHCFILIFDIIKISISYYPHLSNKQIKINETKMRYLKKRLIQSH